MIPDWFPVLLRHNDAGLFLCCGWLQLCLHQNRQKNYHLSDIADVAGLISVNESSMLISYLIKRNLTNPSAVFAIVKENVFITFRVSSKLAKARVDLASFLILFKADQVVRSFVKRSFLSVEDLSAATLVLLKEQVVAWVDPVEAGAMSFDREAQHPCVQRNRLHEEFFGALAKDKLVNISAIKLRVLNSYLKRIVLWQLRRSIWCLGLASRTLRRSLLFLFFLLLLLLLFFLFLLSSSRALT